MTEYGSEFNYGSIDGYISADNGGLKLSGAEYYRSGRDAMKALARLSQGREKLVLLPALCCESMILPFKLNGYEVVFYKLNSDLTGDTGDVLEKLRDGAMLLYMRYFGIRPFEDAFLSSLRQRFRNIVLVEDRTQDIIVPRVPGGFEPDAMLASVRKWAALPDGGVLKTALPHGAAVRDSRFGDMRKAAMEKKDRYLQSFEARLKKEFLEELHQASELLDMSGEPCGITDEYRELLEHTDFESIYRRRSENISRLKARLLPHRESGRLSFLTERPEDSTLYFPIFLKDRDAVQRATAEKAVYCPVIWPMPRETEGICAVSRYVVEHMLAIPCDQRYGAEDMDYIADAMDAALAT